MKNQILNSGDKVQAGGALAVQLAPFGDFKGVLHAADGKTKPIVQYLDGAAFDRILNAWTADGSPELLVDVDHDSCDDHGSTKAYAIVDLGSFKDDERVGFYEVHPNDGVYTMSAFKDWKIQTWLAFDKNDGEGKDEWMSITDVSFPVGILLIGV